jgi:hypothetical protein
MGVVGQRHTPAVLPREWPGNRCMEGWVIQFPNQELFSRWQSEKSTKLYTSLYSTELCSFILRYVFIAWCLNSKGDDITSASTWHKYHVFPHSSFVATHGHAVAHLLLFCSWFLVGSTQNICLSHSQLPSSSVLMLLGREMTCLPSCLVVTHITTMHIICVTHTFLFLCPLLPFCYLHSKKDIEVSIFPLYSITMSCGGICL